MMDETTYRKLINSELPNYGGETYNGLAALGASQSTPVLGTDNTGFVSKLKNLKNPFSTDPSVPTTPNSITPSWMANAQALGTLGLGLASFLDQRKTAGLQRDALRQNLQLSREHQASQKALGASWNKGWGQ